MADAIARRGKAKRKMRKVRARLADYSKLIHFSASRNRLSFGFSGVIYEISAQQNGF
jgi:hypothetical protein